MVFSPLRIRRPTFLVASAWTVHAVSWFLPVVRFDVLIAVSFTHTTAGLPSALRLRRSGHSRTFILTSGITRFFQPSVLQLHSYSYSALLWWRRSDHGSRRLQRHGVRPLPSSSIRIGIFSSAQTGNTSGSGTFFGGCRSVCWRSLYSFSRSTQCIRDRSKQKCLLHLEARPRGATPITPIPKTYCSSTFITRL